MLADLPPEDTEINIYDVQYTKRALMKFAVNAGPDQPMHAQVALVLHCPLTESVDTIVYVDEQKMPRVVCTDVQADLQLCCPQIA